MLTLKVNNKTGEYSVEVKEGHDHSLLVTTELDEVVKFIKSFLLLYSPLKEDSVYAW
jgi:hypothetical protein